MFLFVYTTNGQDVDWGSGGAYSILSESRFITKSSFALVFLGELVLSGECKKAKIGGIKGCATTFWRMWGVSWWFRGRGVVRLEGRK